MMLELLIVLLGSVSIGLCVQIVVEGLGSGLRLSVTRARELGQEEMATSVFVRTARQGASRAHKLLRRLLPWMFAWHDAQRSTRHTERCVRDLPDAIDILTLGLQAGLSFDAALSAYAERFDTPLAAELARAQHSYQLGLCSRSQAFHQLCDRVPDDAVIHFTSVVDEALALGSPLLPTFGTLSFELRRYQKLKLEERIARAPVKLLIPLGLCVLPAVLILLMGPVLIQMIAGLRL